MVLILSHSNAVANRAVDTCHAFVSLHVYILLI